MIQDTLPKGARNYVRLDKDGIQNSSNGNEYPF